MPSPKERLAALRRRRPVVDHLVRTQEHYSAVKAGQQAGAVTYFGFLSFFPILALAFAAVGWIAGVFPDARDATVDAIAEVFPGMIGEGDSQISLDTIENAAGAAVGFGLLGVLYAGLGWLSSMRDALLIVFERPAYEQPSFLIGKLRDLVTLAAVGLVLLLSVGVSGLVGRLSEDILDLLGLGTALQPLLWVSGSADRTAGQHGAVPRALPAAGRPAHTQALAAQRRAAGGGRLRDPQAAVGTAPRHHQGSARLPGVRHRADPGRLDQLLLASGDVRRCLGAHLAAGPGSAR